MDERIARGMGAQLKLRRQRLDGGDGPLGWKVAFSAPEIQQKLGIDGPLVGFLTGGAQVCSGATLPLSDFTKLAVEPEIAIHMGADLAAGSDRETARHAIAGLGPALEIADLTFAPTDVEKILAGNIYQRHVIFGELDRSRAGARLDGMRGRVARQGVEIANTLDLEANTGNLIDIVRHVADTLAQFDQKLRAGQAIIAGSIIPPMWVDEPEEIEFTLEPIGSVSIRFTGPD